MSKHLEVIASVNRASEAEREVEALRAQREALVAAREARAEAAAASASIAEAERALRDEQAIDAAELEHGAVDKRIRVVRSELGVIIVKRAHPAAMKRFLDKGEREMKDLEALVRPCLVYPTLAEWEAMCAEQVILINRSADAIAYLAGVRKADVEGKR